MRGYTIEEITVSIARSPTSAPLAHALYAMPADERLCVYRAAAALARDVPRLGPTMAVETIFAIGRLLARTAA